MGIGPIVMFKPKNFKNQMILKLKYPKKLNWALQKAQTVRTGNRTGTGQVRIGSDFYMDVEQNRSKPNWSALSDQVPFFSKNRSKSDRAHPYYRLIGH